MSNFNWQLPKYRALKMSEETRVDHFTIFLIIFLENISEKIYKMTLSLVNASAYARVNLLIIIYVHLNVLDFPGRRF